MKITHTRKYESKLPANDDHPYRIGAWTPQTTEYDATELDVISGEIPKDLTGVYLRNTENPLLPAIGRYHPFDGDGMLHAISFENGKASYRNRFVQTAGLRAEIEAGEPLWAGIIESPLQSKRDGWGARTKMKDASSTDVVVHNGVAVSTFYQCGDGYQLDPRTLEPKGTAEWAKGLPNDCGVSAHTKVDESTGELLFFNYGTCVPYMHYGVVDAGGKLVHLTPIDLPGARLPHDMCFADNYAILNDFPSFWDPALMEKGAYRAKFHADMPSRFGILPRRGTNADVKWFEASPTYVLHFVNAFEDGDEVVLDGFHQGIPMPKIRPEDGMWGAMGKLLDTHELHTRLCRWRFNLKTGKTTESFLDDQFLEFPTINQKVAGKAYRYAYCMTMERGSFLFKGLHRYDLTDGSKVGYVYPKGVYASESPMAPRDGAKGEDDGYVVTFTIDLNENMSTCDIFDAKDIAKGPIARVRLPERISSGTHSAWAGKDLLA